MASTFHGPKAWIPSRGMLAVGLPPRLAAQKVLTSTLLVLGCFF